MILVWLIAMLMGGGLVSFMAGQWNKTLPRWISLFALFAGFLGLVSLWIEQYGSADTWLVNFKEEWIPSFGITFHLAIDGLSLILLTLTFFIGILAVLCSWSDIKERVGFYHFNLLWILAGISGVFMAMDLFLFYFFWEVMLIPMYFLIGIWGSENRVYAAYKFFIFTQASGLLMFLAILGLFFIHGRNTGVYTYNYFELLGTVMPESTANWLMLGFLIAFIVKLPLVPFHSWLPDAHGEAPTAGSLILAALLLKTGAYGIIRFALPLFPQAAVTFAPWLMLLGVIGIIYGAILAFSQTDLKRLVAYTSVSHMGFVVLGIFAFNELALQGVVMQLVTHAISTGALFIIAGILKERLHTRDIDSMGGLWSQMPKLGFMGMLFAMASLGLPGLGNFIAEFLVLLGAFKVSVWLTVFATLGLIFSAIYSLRIMQKVFFGPVEQEHPVKDLNLRELSVLSLLTISIIWLGIFPQPVLNTVKLTVKSIEQIFVSANKAGNAQNILIPAKSLKQTGKRKEIYVSE